MPSLTSCSAGSVPREKRERWQVLLVLGICLAACLVAVVTLNVGLESPILVQSESKQHTFVNDLAAEVGELDNTKILSRKEQVIDSIKSKLRAAKQSYVPYTSLAQDSNVKALQSKLTVAKKQLADLMTQLAGEATQAR
jgi:hypothetical protein